jgi:hypothetical protein
MFQIDNSTAVAAIPAPTPAGSAGYFTDGNPATGVSATILPAEFMNMLMMENLNVLSAGGIAPAKGQYNQLSLAIAKIVQSGAAGAASESTAGILKLSTSPQVIAGTDDSTAVTPLKLLQKLASYIAQATETAFGWIKIAAQPIVNAGTDDAAAVTAKKLATATQAQAFTAFTTSGSAGVLTVAPTPAITAYVANQRFRLKLSQASTGASTINVSGLGAKSLKQYDSTGAKIPAVFAVGQLSDVEYDGTDFVLLDQLPSVVPQATETVAGIAAIATQTDAGTGSDDSKSITPLKLKVLLNSFGVGGLSPTYPGADLNNLVTFSSSFGVTTGCLNVPPGFATQGSIVRVDVWQSSGVLQQTYMEHITGRTARRAYNGIWSAWDTVIAASSMTLTSASGIGTLKLQNGYIQQLFDTTESTSSSDYKFFPVAFPIECLGVFPVLLSTSTGAYTLNAGIVVGDITSARFLINGGGTFSTEGRFRIMAIGR